MKTIKLMAVVIVITTMIACTGGRRNAESQQNNDQAVENEQTTERQRPDWLPADRIGHTSEMSLDFFGTYEGILPSASGEGIKTVVTLNEDRTFVLRRTYLNGDDGEEFIDQGNYTILWGEIVVLPLGYTEEVFFDLREGSLALLDREMNRIEETPLAPMYVLTMVH